MRKGEEIGVTEEGDVGGGAVEVRVRRAYDQHAAGLENSPRFGEELFGTGDLLERVPDEHSVKRAVCETAVLERAIERFVSMRARKVRRVLSDVHSDRVPAPLACDVQESADITAHFDNARSGRKQEPITSRFAPIGIDVSAEHPLHREGLVVIGLELWRLLLVPHQNVAVAAEQDLGGVAARNVLRVLLLGVVHIAVNPSGEELVAEPLLASNPISRGQNVQIGATTARAVHACYHQLSSCRKTPTRVCPPSSFACLAALLRSPIRASRSSRAPKRCPDRASPSSTPVSVAFTGRSANRWSGRVSPRSASSSGIRESSTRCCSTSSTRSSSTA